MFIMKTFNIWIKRGEIDHHAHQRQYWEVAKIWKGEWREGCPLQEKDLKTVFAMSQALWLSDGDIGDIPNVVKDVSSIALAEHIYGDDLNNIVSGRDLQDVWQWFKDLPWAQWPLKMGRSMTSGMEGKIIIYRKIEIYLIWRLIEYKIC